MLFNSYEFVFAFLPITLLGFFAFARVGRDFALTWLLAASLVFYGWGHWSFLPVIVLSVVCNFLFAHLLARYRRKPLLALGVSLNLAALGWYKYAGFFAANTNALFGTSIDVGNVVLPLGISFFTFQQITYLIETFRSGTPEASLVREGLFVSFFPHLIAGPIVHPREMLPQFARTRFALRYKDLAIGLAIFAIGLLKKAVLADGIAHYATPVFTAAQAGESLDFIRAWGGALAYTMQLYFDFSAYSDMAVGIARMFGIRLPMNFNSPYKATSIIDFWRRWHITLSRFLRNYVYFALGGNRHGNLRRYVNLMATMLIGGLWHGAGWTFVVWGGLHGLYLAVNHFWQVLRHRAGAGAQDSTWLGRRCAHLITLLAVIFGWVFFRATSFDAALRMLEGMAGLNGISMPEALVYRFHGLAGTLAAVGIRFTPGGGVEFLSTWLWLAALSVIVFFAPNTYELMRRYQPVLIRTEGVPTVGAALPQSAGWVDKIAWRMNPRWAVATGVVLAAGILALPRVSEFIYWQF